MVAAAKSQTLFSIGDERTRQRSGWMPSLKMRLYLPRRERVVIDRNLDRSARPSRG